MPHPKTIFFSFLAVACFALPLSAAPDEDCIVVGVDAATIQEAIDLASGTGRTILVPPGTYAESIETPGIMGDTFTIRSQVPGSMVILETPGFNPGSTQVVVNGGDTLSLTDFRVMSDGIGIFGDSGSNLVLTSCELDDNLAAVRLNFASSLTANDCTFRGNGGYFYDGPSIRSLYSPVVLANCEFTDNGGNPEFATSTARGGAVYIEGGSIFATDCLFRGNSAERSFESGNEFNVCEGGAVYLKDLTGFSRFYNCVFDGNQVIADIPLQFGNSALGASLAVRGLETEFNIESCTFQNSLGRFSVSGGYSSGPSDILIEGMQGSSVNFIGNTVEHSRFEYLDLNQNSIDPSNASGVQVRADELLIVGSTFRDLPSRGLSVWNTGNDGEVSVLGSDFVNCGTVVLEVPSTCSGCDFTGTALVSSGDVSSCFFERITSAQAIFGNALTIFGADPVVVTGCIFHQVGSEYIFGSADYTISGSTICGNSATPFAPGANWANVGDNMIEGGPGGAVDCPGYVIRTVPGDYDTIDAALLDANNGDLISIGPGSFSESVDLRGFEDIGLAGAGAELTVLEPGVDGPVVRIDGGEVTVANLTISGGSPGIQVDSGVLGMAFARLVGNAGPSGSAMTVRTGGQAYLGSVTCDGNISTGDGGAVAVETGGFLQAINCIFSANISDGSGGAIHAADGALEVEIIACTFDSNIALGNGGALRLGAAASASCTDSSFTSNEGGRFGGAASVVSCQFDGCTFTANSADEIGGAVRSDGSSRLIGCSLFSNTAQRAGGLAGTAVETFVDQFDACGNTGGDWFGNILDLEGVPLFCSSDCNGNGVDDAQEIESGLATDCNANGTIDACEDLADLDQNGVPDACDLTLGDSVLIVERDRINGLPASSVDVLVRPLYRDPVNAHDILVLDPELGGQILPIRPDGTGGYDLIAPRPGSDFEGCCLDGSFPTCLNNGPGGGTQLVYARGDVLIAHSDKDTGLYDEDFLLYYGCDAPSGQGAPEDITDYDLAPQSEFLLAHEYLPEPEGALAGGGLEANPRTKGQAVLGVRRPNTVSAATGGRRGSGQGGAGPYPGVDAEDLFDYAVSDMAVGDFNGDGSDDLVVLNQTSSLMVVRTFTGLADYIDEQGRLVPSGATWSAPVLYGLGLATPLAVVAGDFVDFPGSADDGLDDFALLVDDQGVKQLWMIGSTGSGVLDLLDIYVDLGDTPQLGVIGTGLGGRDIVLLAQSFPGGMAYLDYIAVDSADPNQLITGYQALQTGVVTGLSTSKTNEGGSPRELAAVLLDRGAESAVHVLELSMRPGFELQTADECVDAVQIFAGERAFVTDGATSSDAPLDEVCWSDGEQQPSNDIWFRWVAPYSGQAVVSTCGAANFDTWLVAYQDSCAGAVVACNDQNPECVQNTSEMEFEVVGGTPYLLRVGGWANEAVGSGTLSITVALAPGDLDANGQVDGADLTLLLSGWGESGPGDLNGDDIVDGQDLTQLLADWTG